MYFGLSGFHLKFLNHSPREDLIFEAKDQISITKVINGFVKVGLSSARQLCLDDGICARLCLNLRDTRSTLGNL